MNYAEALDKKVQFEKLIKPIIKEQHDYQLRLMKDWKWKINLMEIIYSYNKKKKWARKYDDFCGEQKATKRGGEVAHGMHEEDMLPSIKKDYERRKTAVFIWTNLYKGDGEKASTYFPKYKQLVCEEMEEFEEGTGLGSCGWRAKDEDGIVKHDFGDAAYLSCCNSAKDRIFVLESLIKGIIEYNNIAKPILKAGKRMNKRNGKKNRGKK